MFENPSSSVAWKLIIVSALFCFCVGSTAKFQDADIIEIYESDGHHTLKQPPTDVPPLILRVPKDFRIGSSKGAKRNWGISMLTYYPSFSSPSQPENMAYGLSCAGRCNGRIILFISSHARSLDTNHFPNSQLHSPSSVDLHARYLLEKRHENSMLRDPKTRKRDSNLAPINGFTEGFQLAETIPLNPYDTNSKKYNVINQYFLRRKDQLTRFDLVAECQINTWASTCQLHLSLSCNPTVNVKVSGIELSDLSLASDIAMRTERFVSAMIVSPPCKFGEVK